MFGSEELVHQYKVEDPFRIRCNLPWSISELQKRANSADQSVLIFGKSTRKTGENTRKPAKNLRFLVLIFLGEKLVGANFYAFCNYGRWFQLF